MAVEYNRLIIRRFVYNSQQPTMATMYSYIILVSTNIILLLYVRLARAKRQTKPEIYTSCNTTQDWTRRPTRTHCLRIVTCCYYYRHR